MTRIESQNEGKSHMSQETVTINGVSYDSHTGLPVQKSESQMTAIDHQPRPRQTHSQPSHQMHRRVQKSQTLNRRTVQKKVTAQIAPTATKPQAPTHTISKFAAHPAGAQSKRRVMSDIGPSTHPMARKVQKKTVAAQMSTQKPTLKPSHIIKQEAITEALAKSPAHHKNSKQVKSSPKKASRAFSLASASLALLLLGGYFTYVNMPSLSVRVAAAQAGINASYPSYRPDGYSLAGPIAYNSGQVNMKFAANAGPQNFTISQEKTNWDSSALKENLVKQQWGDNVETVTERGLTIFRNDGNAVWVNDGILYKIDGDAPLTPSQVRTLATSM